jgi:DNA replication protein DnaC
MNDVFPLYRSKTLDDFEATTPNLGEAVKVTRNYIDNLKEMKDQGKGITFVGQNGVGKTHLACCVLSAAKGHTVKPYKIECIELSTYIDLHLEMFRVNGRLRNGFDEDQERSYELDERIRYIQMGARFLLLDDIGREHESESGWSNQQVVDLLRFRHNRLLPTLITTNVPLPELDLRYGEGLSSFLREATVVVWMDGEDYRVVNADATWTDRN